MTTPAIRLELCLLGLNPEVLSSDTLTYLDPHTRLYWFDESETYFQVWTLSATSDVPQIFEGDWVQYDDYEQARAVLIEQLEERNRRLTQRLTT